MLRMRTLLALWLLAAPGPVFAHDPLPGVYAQAVAGFPEHDGDDKEFTEPFDAAACRRADRAQTALVDRGNALKDRYLAACRASGADASWCAQSMRPNPDSRGAFVCTYGEAQPHQLIHPDQATWPHAFKALALISELSARGISVCLVNNWWRPEPYNANVGGAPGRHPAGTAVDVKFCSASDRERAFVELCRLRRQGRLRALGYYPGSTVLHFGVGDSSPNTWGKSCP